MTKRRNDDSRAGGSGQKSRPIGSFYAARKVAKMLDMSVSWVYERVKAGDLPGYRLGCKLVIPADALNDYLEKRRV